MERQITAGRTEDSAALSVNRTETGQVSLLNPNIQLFVHSSHPAYPLIQFPHAAAPEDHSQVNGVHLAAAAREALPPQIIHNKSVITKKSKFCEKFTRNLSEFSIIILAIGECIK